MMFYKRELLDVESNKENYRFALNLMYQSAVNPDIFLEYDFRKEFGPKEKLDDAEKRVKLYFDMATDLEAKLKELPETKTSKEFTFRFLHDSKFPPIVLSRN